LGEIVALDVPSGALRRPPDGLNAVGGGLFAVRNTASLSL
jgi:hypothetical protein